MALSAVLSPLLVPRKPLDRKKSIDNTPPTKNKKAGHTHIIQSVLRFFVYNRPWIQTDLLSRVSQRRSKQVHTYASVQHRCGNHDLVLRWRPLSPRQSTEGLPTIRVQVCQSGHRLTDEAKVRRHREQEVCILSHVLSLLASREQ